MEEQDNKITGITITTHRDKEYAIVRLGELTVAKDKNGDTIKDESGRDTIVGASSPTILCRRISGKSAGKLLRVNVSSVKYFNGTYTVAPGNYLKNDEPTLSKNIIEDEEGKYSTEEDIKNITQKELNHISHAVAVASIYDSVSGMLLRSLCYMRNNPEMSIIDCIDMAMSTVDISK